MISVGQVLRNSLTGHARFIVGHMQRFHRGIDMQVQICFGDINTSKFFNDPITHLVSPG
jgi:hypothetical protein